MNETETDRLPAIADDLRLAARRFGTPTYVTDVGALEDAARELARAFPDPWIRQYSVKANHTPAVIAAVARAGIGANVVSRGEWALARRAGVPNGRITLEGIGKTQADLRTAVRAAADGDPLAWVAIESVEEGDALVRLARAAGFGGGGGTGPRRAARRPLEVLFRLNPDVVPETHAGLAVGAGASKFGLTETELSAIVERVAAEADGPIVARGIQLHVGSQLGAIDAWRDGVRRGLALLALIRGNLDDFDTLDVGGGFPVVPLGESGPRPERFAREIPMLLNAVPTDRRPRRWATEPGRFLVARAGWLLGRVLHVRDRGGRQVVLDTGMTELLRPALYGARHDIVALTSFGRPVDPASGESSPAGFRSARLEGPICESTDHLGEHRLPALRRGDLVVIRDAGAYGASLGSSYNGRPRPPQVLLERDGRLVLGRRRGSIASLG
ncbi:MAG: hypothetical protein H0V74_02640 [Chloroflexi bacterium]|nr:hypothetical protein [Chloroflexota bacterium]